MGGAALLAQTPSVTQVGNAGNYGTNVAQGSIFVVIGTNLGPAALIQASSFPLATTLSGTSVRLTPAGGGAPVDAFPVYTVARQVAAILPSNAAPGNYNLTVSFNGATSAPVSVPVVQRSYGMVTLNSRGTGTAVLQNASDGLRVNQFIAPVRPGQVLVLWGTGLGPVRVPDNAAPGAQDLRGDVEIRVLVGGVEVTPVYAGRSPDLPGADQINFAVPDNAPTGCTVPLAVRVGNQTSPAASIAIAPAGRAVCEHPFLSEASLRQIDNNGDAVYGGFAISAFSFQVAITGLPIPLPPIDVRAETAGGAFQRISRANFDEVTTELAPPIGGCVVTPGQLNSSGQRIDRPVTGLDAGGLTLSGPNVANRAFDRLPGNGYSLSLAAPSTTGASAAVIAAGTYTLAGAGGADVGPFNAQVRVSGALNWTNRDAITQVTRANPLTINWSGAAAEDLVVIQGLAGRQSGGTAASPNYDGALFACYARGSANTFTVPPSILQQLPQADGISITGLTPNLSSIGLLIVSSANANEANGRFTAPLRAGGNIDFGFLGYAFGGAKTLNYR